jgi:hypothetical protein
MSHLVFGTSTYVKPYWTTASSSVNNDPCLMYTATIMVVVYVDDLGIAYANAHDLGRAIQET